MIRGSLSQTSLLWSCPPAPSHKRLLAHLPSPRGSLEKLVDYTHTPITRWRRRECNLQPRYEVLSFISFHDSLARIADPFTLTFRLHSRDSFDGTTSSSSNSSNPAHNVIIIDNPTNALASDDVLGPICEQEQETNDPTITTSRPSAGAHSHCNRFTNAGRKLGMKDLEW
jgi:hypothetical protein